MTFLPAGGLPAGEWSPPVDAPHAASLSSVPTHRTRSCCRRRRRAFSGGSFELPVPAPACCATSQNSSCASQGSIIIVPRKGMSERRFDLLHLLLPIIRGVSPESLAPGQYARLPDWGCSRLGGFRFARLCSCSYRRAEELQGEGYAVRLFLDGVMSSD